MKAFKKSSTITLDEVRLEYLRDPKHTSYAMKLALEEFEQDNDVDRLLDTLRLVAQAQGGLAALARKTHLRHIFPWCKPLACTQSPQTSVPNSASPELIPLHTPHSSFQIAIFNETLLQGFINAVLIIRSPSPILDPVWILTFEPDPTIYNQN
jgi:hypothetical protein